MPSERCFACGARSGLTVRPVYVGGRGYEQTTECADKPACWARQDERADERAIGKAA